ncbi:hypothetical protein GCWU000324_01749 [Kingella oralis ATCC 51147]|uniref:Uncharacterized protein n=1 Tax=Kingella oralis ATCC 51147 TaxID=629741 RepID=C4GL92_9NEIS|nr:hypothetical protein GCWU000324_01749 [Kingella oralis ATCC 51147]
MNTGADNRIGRPDATCARGFQAASIGAARKQPEKYPKRYANHSQFTRLNKQWAIFNKLQSAA